MPLKIKGLYAKYILGKMLCMQDPTSKESEGL